MKAPAFQFYARDFRASLSVTVMSSAQRGGYIMLLAAAWDFDKPGYLPNDDDLLRLYSGMTEDEWKAGSGRLLKQFPLTEDGLLRYNARLISEVEKQANYRESRAKGGQAAAAKRAAAQQEASIKSSYAEQTPAYEQPEASIAPTLLSASASSIKDERTAGGQAVSASLSKSTPGEGKAGGPAGKPREYLADEAPIFQAAAFTAFTDKMGYAKIDKGHYLLRIQRKAEKLLARTNEGWENFILTWLDKDQKAHTLQLVDQRAHVQPVDNSRFGPAERPLTTGYSIAARLQEQNVNDYL